MELHRRIGTVFTIFCAFALASNLLTVGNPDRMGNLVQLSVLFIVFAMTIFMPKRYGGNVQLSCLLIVSAMAPGTPGGPFLSAFIMIFSMVLFYAYNGFKTLRGIKVGLSMGIVYVLMAINLSRVVPDFNEMLIESLTWSTFIYVFCYALWVIAEDIDTKFHTVRERELLEENRELIKLNHDILDATRCEDAP